MRFVSIEVKNVLGLQGTIDFVKNPTLFYGRNLSGKTNVINLIRYCFVFKKASRKYTEEKRLDRDELLITGPKEGRAVFHFDHRNRLYKLEYLFKKAVRNVSQKIQLYEAPTRLPVEGSVHASLKAIQWMLIASNANQLKEKFSELGIYSDVIDSLISPSNVKNFSDAINKELVTVPDIIATEISKVNKGAAKIGENLQKFTAVLVQEKEVYSNKLGRLKTDFAQKSSMTEAELGQMFTLGSISRNLNMRIMTTETEISKLPTEEFELKYLREKLGSEFREKIDCISDAKRVLQQQSEAVDQVKHLGSVSQNFDAMRVLETTVKNLPSKENISGLADVDMPSRDSINFTLLVHPERIRTIFESVAAAKSCLRAATSTAKKYDVALRLRDVTSLTSAYKQLAKSIKSPKERPNQGDDVIISYSKEEGQSTVFIPLTILLDRPSYLKGIGSTPSVFKSAGLSNIRLGQLAQQVEIKTRDLEKCKENLRLASDREEETRKSLQSVADELRFLGETKKDLASRLQARQVSWDGSLKDLTRSFGLQPFKHSLETEEGIRQFLTAFRPLVQAAESRFIDKVKQMFGQAGIKLNEDMDVEKLTNVGELVEKRSAELTETRKRLENEKTWMNTHLNEIKESEEKIVAIRFIESAIGILSELLQRIHQHTNLEVMVGQIAENIHQCVDQCERMILPEETVVFKHAGGGNFLIQDANGQPVTHPGGSHKAVISLGIMFALSKLFNLPLILDEATDRFDYVALRNTFRYVSMLCKSPEGPQVCLVSYKTLNIERSGDILDALKDWNIYLLDRRQRSDKEIIKIADVNQILA